MKELPVRPQCKKDALVFHSRMFKFPLVSNATTEAVHLVSIQDAWVFFRDPSVEPSLIALGCGTPILGLQCGTHIGQHQRKYKTGIPELVQKTVSNLAG